VQTAETLHAPAEAAHIGKSGSPTSRLFYLGVLLASILLAFMKRAEFNAPMDFPLGEGGLFVLFSQEIAERGFALPAEIVYGGLRLPFAYPPLSFYFAAVLARLTSADLLAVYYWLPLVLNMLAVPAFCFLAAQVTKSRVVFLSAVLLYVQLPDSFIWQITAGGVPRAMGALFAIMAVGVALSAGARRPAAKLLLSGACVGIAILSHLEWGIFAAVGVTLAVVARVPEPRKQILFVAAQGLIALAVITPWLTAVLLLHGFDPFLSSASASQWNLGTFLGNLLSGRVFGLLVLPALLGAWVTLNRGKWFLITWLIVTLLLTPRMGGSAGFAIPGALLAGYGIKAIGEYVLAQVLRGRGVLQPLARIGHLAGVGLPVALLLFFFSAVLATPLRFAYHSRTIAEQVSPSARQAMQWIRDNTAPESSFVVITGAEGWWADKIAEWFPYLTARASLTTVQGLEWAGEGVFVAKVAAVEALKASKAAPSLVRRSYCGADYVAVFSDPHAERTQAFFEERSFRPVFSNEGATIFEASGCSR
jgi:hypothetical protein